MSNPQTAPRTAGGDVVISQAVVDQFIELVSVIPDAATGGVENILSQIFAATVAADLEKPWADPDRGMKVGTTYRVDSVAKAASEFQGGLPFYLLCQVINLDTGEVEERTTGSVSTTAQLAQAYVLGLLPITVKLVEATEKSKNGYYPQHLEVIEAATSKPKARRRG